MHYHSKLIVKMENNGSLIKENLKEMFYLNLRYHELKSNTFHFNNLCIFCYFKFDIAFMKSISIIYVITLIVLKPL